jgi:iron complex outermembrane receptor protein
MPLVSSQTPPFTTMPSEILETEGNNVIGRWTHTFPGQSVFQTQLYFDRAQRILEPQFGTLDVNTVDLDTQHRLPAKGRIAWTYGFGGRFVWDDLDERFTVSWTELSRSAARASAFVQAEIGLIPGELTLTAGSKFEHHEYSGFETQPSVRMLWSATPSQVVWGAVSGAVRTPSRADDSELANVVPAGVQLSLRPNTSLEAEDMLAWELGYRYQVTDRLMVDVATFLNFYNDLYSFRTFPIELGGPLPVLPVSQENAMDGTVYGLELGARWLVDPKMRLDLGLTLLRDDLDALDEQAGFPEETLEQDEGNSPAQQWSVRSSMDLPHRIELDAGVRYVGHLETPEVPAYLVGDVRVGWLWTDRLDVSLTGRNIGPDHPEFGPAASGDAVRPEVEPRVFVTLRWKL